MKERLLALLTSAAILVPITPASTAERSVCTINWYDERQLIEGFGGSIGGNRGALAILKRDDLLEKIFDPEKGIGLSILRANVPEESDKAGAGIVSIEPEQGEWYWDGDKYEVEIMQYAQQFGTRIMATPWSAPYWMKSKGSVIGGTLREDMYDEYAKYLAEYVKGYKEHHGITISDISIQNEPNAETAYSSSLFSGDQFYDFLKNHMIPYFEKEKIPANIIMPEEAGFTFERAEKSLEDEYVRNGIGILAAHAYWANARYRYDRGKELLKPIWQTEFCILEKDTSSIENGVRNAEVVHAMLTDPEVNAFIFWFIATTGYYQSEALISIFDDGIYLNKRFYTFGNFSRFVRPGYIRIGSDSSPTSDLFVTTFKSPDDGTMVMVVINDSTQTNKTRFVFDGFDCKTAKMYRTSEKEDLEYIGDISCTDKGFESEFLQQSVTTFVFNVDSVTPQNGRLEAESCSSKIGNAKVVSNKDFSQNEGVGCIGSKDNGIEFKNMRQSDKTVIRYCSTDNYEADIYVNGELKNTVTIPMTTNANVDYADYVIDTAVPEGGSLKILSHRDITSPLIDYIEPYTEEMPLQTVSNVEYDSSWADKYVEQLIEKGVANSNFTADGFATKSEFVEMLVKKLGLSAVWSENFFDASDKKEYYQYIGIARALGIVPVGDNWFYPDTPVSKEEMLIYTANALKSAGMANGGKSGSSISGYSELSEEGRAAADVLLGQGLVSENDELRGNEKVRRAEAAMLLTRIGG